MSVLERCPSYRESNKWSKERQRPTLSVRFTEVSVKRESTVQSNLSTTVTVGTEESGFCGEVAVLGRLDCTEVFLAYGGNFRCWPKADTSSVVGRSHTETGNRARKVSGTQGKCGKGLSKK